MITNPTPQRALRGYRATRPTPRVANSADHQAALARRLTPRDKWIIHLAHEHRVLTTTQITALAFPSPRAARQRLRELFCWSVLDRFQPFITRGSAPLHYVLASAGASVLAAEHGLQLADLGHRHTRALSISHSLRLAHTVAVNDWFTALIHHARHHSNTQLGAWWSETRCGRHFGDLVRPDAYGRWRAHHREIEFFLELDFGTEALQQVAAKLTGYAALATSTAITTPVLVWLPTTSRETAARRLLTDTWRHLDEPHLVPTATAAADLLTTPDASPADPVWLPLTPTATRSARLALHHLLDTWPHLPPPTTQPEPENGPPPASAPATLPPPVPTPPAPSNSPHRQAPVGACARR